MKKVTWRKRTPKLGGSLPELTRRSRFAILHSGNSSILKFNSVARSRRRQLLPPRSFQHFKPGNHVCPMSMSTPNSNEPYVAVTRPIVLRDGSKALLTITTSTLALNWVLAPSVPAGWVVGVGDRSGVYVTRSARHDEVSGKPGVAAYLSKAVGRFGSFTSANQFGEKLLAGYHRSEFSDWLFAANISLATVEAPLWRSLFGRAWDWRSRPCHLVAAGLRDGQDVHR